MNGGNGCKTGCTTANLVGTEKAACGWGVRTAARSTKVLRSRENHVQIDEIFLVFQYFMFEVECVPISDHAIPPRCFDFFSGQGLEE